MALLGGLLFVVFAALLLRLWALQVLSGTHYVAQAQANQFRTVRVQAPRGPILDRNGKVLVTNAATTAIELWSANLPKVYKDRYDELRSLAQVTRVPLYQIAAKIKRRRDAGDMLTPIVIRDDAGRRHGMMQVAGFLARRIVCRVRAYDKVSAGQRIGLIMFGSRVDHFIPPGYRVVVRVGDRVRAGESIIGELADETN